MIKFETNPHRNRALSRSLALIALIASSTMVAACSHKDSDDLAVAKMSESQVQTTAYLPLNDDKPGTLVDPRKYLATGKFTIVEYYSPYSPESISFGPGLRRLSQQRPDIAVRTVNVNRPGIQGIDFQSPVMHDLQLSGLPYFQIYEPSGSLRAHARPAYEQVVQWVR